MAKELESVGVKSILLPYGAVGPDYFVFVPELLLNTKTIKFMMAVRPYSITPEWVAKTYRTIIQYGDRVTLNVVAGSFSPQEQDLVLNAYPGDPETIDTIDKRIEYSEKWTEKLYEIMGNQRPETYTITNSERTMRLANYLFDSAIFVHHRMEYNVKNKTDRLKLVLAIDPLILDSLDQVTEYAYDLNADDGLVGKKVQEHAIYGTYEQVKHQLIKISEGFGVSEFLIHTDQKDPTNIIRLIKDLSSSQERGQA